MITNIGYNTEKKDVKIKYIYTNMSPLNEDRVTTPNGVVVRGEVVIEDPYDTTMTREDADRLTTLYRQPGAPRPVDGNLRRLLPSPDSADSETERSAPPDVTCRIFGPPIKRHRPQLKVIRGGRR